MAPCSPLFELRGDIPYFKLYDRQGTLRYTFSNDPDGLEKCEPIDQIDKRVAELLAENAPSPQDTE